MSNGFQKPFSGTNRGAHELKIGKNVFSHFKECAFAAFRMTDIGKNVF
jgi:hypothetical protein